MAWWDGLELWLAQQAFALQFVLVMAVLAPLCVGLALLLDRVGAVLLARLGRGGDDTGVARRRSSEHG